jgi:hypothetical protein
MTRGLLPISIIVAMRGGARTPLTIALQKSAVIGSSGVKARSAPSPVAAAIAA